MSQSHEEIRALRVMVEELRAEPLPELPWDAIEQRLLARLPVEGSARARAKVRWSESPVARMVGLCAAAAAIALGVGHAGGSSAVGPVIAFEDRRVDAGAIALAPGAAGDRGARDLSALSAGDRIEAGADPLTFARDGLASWTLAPHSAIRVVTMGDGVSGVGHTVALERGSLRAEVTPRDASEGLVEAFAVEVAGTRVAVHGTAFSVRLEDGRAVVDVEHGAVAVGPVGHRGATTGHLLVGPARASFSLDGARQARMLPPERAPIAVAASPAVVAPAPSPAATLEALAPPEPKSAVAPAVQAVAARPAEAPAEPKGVAVEPAAPDAAPAAAPEPPLLTVAGVRARLDRCFRAAHEPGSPSVLVSVDTTLRLSLHADGTVRAARFDPPIKPELQSCAFGVMAGRFAPGAASVDIPLHVDP